MPSRVDSKSSSIIDLCFTNVKYFKLAGVLNVNLSDHLLTFVIKKKNRETKSSHVFTGRNDQNLSTETVKYVMATVQPPIGGEQYCPNRAWDAMHL